MKKLITIKEYDNLTTNRDFAKLPSYQYIDKESFSQLETLVLSVDEGEQSNAIDLMSLSSKRNVGKVLRAKNYVGIVQLKNGTQIEILPKIHERSEEDSKTVFLKMLKSLKNFSNKAFQNTKLNTSKMSIFEIFIKLFIDDVQRLVKRGLKSAYYEVEDNLRVYKGKMLFSKQIKHNAVHKERFYVQYDEFGVNRAENRLIKSALLLLLKESNSVGNIRELRKLLLHFELVEPSKNYIKDFSAVKIDRHLKDYENLIQWSEIFLKNKSFTTFSGASFGKALLFPMDKLFESYIGKQLKRAFDNEWIVNLQHTGYYLFDQKFALRPDSVLTNDTKKKVIVLDTKWKLLVNEPMKNYGISQADMYQMYAYFKKYAYEKQDYSHEVWLIYPITNDFEEGQVIRFESNDKVKVNIFFVDCYRIEESIKKLITYVNKEDGDYH